MRSTPLALVLITSLIPLAGCSSNDSEVAQTSCPGITAEGGLKERTYRHADLGFIIPLPAFLCDKELKPSPQGTGIFVRNDGVTLTVMGDLVKNSDVKITTEDVQAYWKGRNGSVVYASRPEFGAFSVSGIIGSDIYYERYLVKDGVYRKMLWIYPVSLKEQMDKPVTSSVVNFNFGDPKKPAA